MSEKVLNRLCPICSSSTGEILHNQSFVSFKDSPLPLNYDIVSCPRCGFVFADTSASQEDYNTYYTVLSKYEDINLSSGGGFNQSDFKRLTKTADYLENQLNKNDSVLDIGCANGGQLKVLKERGFFNLTGVDPSKTCVKNVESAGITAFQAHLFEKSFQDWDRRFDLIILSHVLEHIRDLESAINIIKNKLNRKGIIYVEVPDASRYSEFYVVPYYYIDCEHINHFSKVSLNNLMVQFGFANIEVVTSTMNLNDTTDYPILYSLFRQNDETNKMLIHDISLIKSFNIFLNESKAHGETNRIIEELVSSQEEIIIWGAGQFTLRLLASSSLSKANILGFVDSDKNKQNKKIGKFDVHSPDYISNKNARLLICSALYAKEILNTAQLINKNIKYIVLN